jgi:hypothetical protein
MVNFIDIHQLYLNLKVSYGEVVIMARIREVTVREIKGRKTLGGKTYEYVYYTLPLNLYIRKHIVEKWGKEFIVERDDDKGIIIIKPKKLAEEEAKHSSNGG